MTHKVSEVVVHHTNRRRRGPHTTKLVPSDRGLLKIETSHGHVVHVPAKQLFKVVDTIRLGMLLGGVL